jgi:tetratricopeptide (TPR) repeat protein
VSSSAPAAGAPASSRRFWDGPGPALLVGAAAFLAFLRSAWCGFAFDDHRFILKNAHVQATESWLRLFTDASTVDPDSPGGIVRPLRTVEFALDRALFGPGPAAFHLHSLLWHAAGAALLVLVLRRLLGDGRIAALGALLWAVHPVQTESVALVSSRGDVAMGACVLASALFALRTRGRDLDLALSLAFGAAAMLYKETAVVLPLLVAALRLTRFARAPVTPYALLAGVYLVYRSAVQVGPTGHGVTFELGGGPEGTFATMMRGFGFYLVEPLLPAHTLDWYMTPSRSFADAAAVAWGVVHVGILATAAVLARRAPAWTLAVAWFYGFLLPVANWPWFSGIPTTERFLYLPLAGFALAVAVGARRTGTRAVPALGVVAVAFAAASFDRIALWEDDRSLWTGTLAHHESPRARAHVADRAREEALALRTRAAAMPPGAERQAAEARVASLLERALADYHRALGLWYAFEGAPRSKANFARVVETNASQSALLLGRHEEALRHADEALLAGNRETPETHYDRAFALLELGFAPQAMAAMRRARALGFGEPDEEFGRFFLRASEACRQDGLLDTAAEGYATAAECSPPGALREAAYLHLAAIGRIPREPDAKQAERARLLELEERLAALPRRCPARVE